MDFPLTNAPLDVRLDAIGELLAATDIVIDGIRLAALVTDLHDAALIVRAHHAECPPMSRAVRKVSMNSKAILRRNYG